MIRNESRFRRTGGARAVLAAALVATCAGPFAAPAFAGAIDPDEKVYSPIVDEDADGDAEVELRQGADLGRNARGAAGGVIEIEQALARKVSVAGLVFWSREPGKAARIDELGLESVINLGRLPGTDIDYGTYVELAQGLYGQGAELEVKALFQRRAGPWDARLNLIAAQPFKHGEQKVEWSWAASLDRAVTPRVRLGVAAYSDAGAGGDFGGRRQALIGPQARIEGPVVAHVALNLTAAWLAPFGAGQDGQRSQARIGLELEKRF
jgi:hypothetical protein